MDTRRILTGIRPTGALHLGHYVGALKQWLLLQEEYECFFLIADVQALTTHVKEPKLIKEAVREVLLDFISVGLDPTRENVYFILQSGIPELTELTAYFTMIVPFTAMEHNPTIRAELKQLQASPTAGFMIYPISQAADILLFTPYPPEEYDRLLVPVGEDQVPHLEETNKIARKFNQQYKQIFVECTPKVGDVGKLVGTNGKEKMSKSLGNAIFLKDDADTVEKQVRKMFTDPKKQKMGDVGHPKKCPVYLYHKSFGGTLKARAERCRKGSLGCVECKKDLTEALNVFLNPIRARRAEAEKMPLGDFLRQGNKKAREVGGVTMEAVRKAMHLDYPDLYSASASPYCESS